MRITHKFNIILLTFLIVTNGYDVKNKLSELIQTGTRSNEAVESIFDLLHDLKTENVNFQTQSDQKIKNNEIIASQTLKDFDQISNMNKNNYEQATQNRMQLESQINDIQNWQQWAQTRLGEIDRRTGELSQQRCFANGLFVKSLSDHQDAKQVIQALKNDLSGYIDGSQQALVQNSVSGESVADKLLHYSHLFHEQAMSQFFQLSTNQDREMGKAEAQNAFNQLIDLESQIDQTIKDLESQEVQAAQALSKWITDAHAEQLELAQNQERMQVLLEKLISSRPAALSQEAKANKIYTDSVNIIKTVNESFKADKDYSAEEIDRKNQENDLMDSLIKLFRDQVNSLVKESQ